MILTVYIFEKVGAGAPGYINCARALIVIVPCDFPTTAPLFQSTVALVLFPESITQRTNGTSDDSEINEAIRLKSLNEEVVSGKIEIHHVEKDRRDVVARYPFRKNPELDAYFQKIDHPAKEQNLKIHTKKAREKLIKKVQKKAFSRVKGIFHKRYCHERVY